MNEFRRVSVDQQEVWEKEKGEKRKQLWKCTSGNSVKICHLRTAGDDWGFYCAESGYEFPEVDIAVRVHADLLRK
jgi:hypothetical protein